LRQDNRRNRRSDGGQAEDDGFVEQLIEVNRVMRVRKGGPKQSFNAIMVVGDRAGTVGIGFGKANDVPEAIRKSIEAARKRMFKVPIVKGTIPHAIVGEFGTARVVLRPATPGTGVVAGGAARLILETAGIHDVLGKCLGSRSKMNAAAATIDGLKRLRDAAMIARLRGKEVRELFS